MKTEQSARQAIATALGWKDGRELRLTRLASGIQSQVFRAELAGGGLFPDSSAELVVKLYNSGASADVAQREFDSLGNLHQILDGRGHDGWTIATPRPIALSTAPPALVVTRVPGRSLETLLRRRALASQDIRSLAALTHWCLEEYWRGAKEIYGDTSLNNILCAPATKTVAMIDPSPFEEAFYCQSVSERWYFASRDIGHLVFTIAASNPRVRLTNPAGANAKTVFAEAILACLFQTVQGADERSALSDELSGCVDVHLARISGAGLPRGWWRKLVKRSTRRHIERWLDRAAKT